MSFNSLNLPLDIPWKVLTASGDMMDPTFEDTAFPSPWRTSLAISAYEPSDDVQSEVAPCGERISFLRITTSLTGYVPTKDEVARGFVVLGDAPEVRGYDILGDYYGCYGALLNVSVFPNGGARDNNESSARIIDFEPKTRDLYQSSSENGEILSGSDSEVTTNKSWGTTSSTETGLKAGGKYLSPPSEYGSFEGTGEMSHKWGKTNTDGSQTTVDGSRDRREKWASSTLLSQLYSLLTGYHAGTNRAAFLMLPRPHMLESTNRRTFARGVRVIEGVQEFFLIVTRPADERGLCVSVSLDTGHYPEKVGIAEPKTPRDEQSFVFTVKAHAKGAWGTGNGDETDLSSVPGSRFDLPSGWIVDKFGAKGDPGHPGVRQIANRDDARSMADLKGYNYQAVGDIGVQISGKINGGNFDFSGTGANFDRDYEVFAWREKPGLLEEEAKVTTPMLIVNRLLSTCYLSDDDGCISGGSVLPPNSDAWIVDERAVSFQARLRGGTVDVPSSEVLHATREALIGSLRMPTRRARGKTGFLTTDLFAAQVVRHLREGQLDQQAEGLNEVKVTVRELLESSTLSLAITHGLLPEEVSTARAQLLGVDVGSAAVGASAAMTNEDGSQAAQRHLDDTDTSEVNDEGTGY